MVINKQFKSVSMFLIFVVFFFLVAFFFISNSPFPEFLSLKSQRITVSSSVPAFQLTIKDQSDLNYLFDQRALFTRGATPSDRNVIKKIRSIHIELVDEPQTMITTNIQGQLVSSGHYQVNGTHLNLKIYIDPNFLNQDLDRSNWLFTRKLVEFIVAATPKIDVPANNSPTNFDTNPTQTEVDKLEFEVLGGDPFSSNTQPIRIEAK